MIFRPVEALAVLFGIGSVYLSVRENVLSWPTGIVNVTLYVFIFYEARLYAGMALQVFFAVISIYGWYQWLHGGDGRAPLRVSRATPREGVVLTGIGLASSAVIGTVLARYTDASLPYLDATTTAASLVAQWMMARKVLENWVVWVAVDTVSVGMFLYKSLYLTAALYAVFLVLGTMGYLQWKKSLLAPQAA